jgi:hypothetical protein
MHASCRFAAFQGALEAFAAALGQPLPEIQQGAMPEDTDTVHIVANSALAGSPDGLWDDDHMAYFYTNLPNLTSVVPSMALNNGKGQEGEEAPSGEGETQPNPSGEEVHAAASDGAAEAEDEESVSGGVLMSCHSHSEPESSELFPCFFPCKTWRSAQLEKWA